MKVTSTGILHGVISDEYGKRGTQFNAHGMPTYSLPLSIQAAPAGTVSYAIVLEDKEQSLIKSKITKYLKIILYKNKEKKHIIK